MDYLTSYLINEIIILLYNSIFNGFNIIVNPTYFKIRSKHIIV